ncbi:MAG TPA: M48 family metalloprotease [Candidatus Methylomirabilis sp.]|nr:M48 family metalloprotease [Candidatus Methylomirabilis sp.]
MSIRAIPALVTLAALATGCASAPAGSYFPPPSDPATARVAQSLHSAAFAAGDDPSRYSFAFVSTREAAVYSDEERTFYITDGLLRLPPPVVDAIIAHEVAHEVMGHAGTRRTLSLTLSAGFGAAGMVAPGAGLVDLIVNPLAVRAFTRRQELVADQKAVEILRAMGYPAPRRTLADALRSVDGVTPKPKEELTGLLSAHADLKDRLAALEPLEPVGSPVTSARHTD